MSATPSPVTDKAVLSGERAVLEILWKRECHNGITFADFEACKIDGRLDMGGRAEDYERLAREILAALASTPQPAAAAETVEWAVAAERERCAKIAERETGYYPSGNMMFGPSVPRIIAAAIRQNAKGSE